LRQLKENNRKRSWEKRKGVGSSSTTDWVIRCPLARGRFILTVASVSGGERCDREYNSLENEANVASVKVSNNKKLRSQAIGLKATKPQEKKE